MSGPMRTARVHLEGDWSREHWVEGAFVHGAEKVIIGRVLSTGQDDDGDWYAECELFPAAYGEADDEPFG